MRTRREVLQVYLAGVVTGLALGLGTILAVSI